jgi:manganese transport protein
MRWLEAGIVALVATIGGCYLVEIWLAQPDWSGVLAGLLKPKLSGERLGGGTSDLYVAIGIIGATVMPHNLYLHSALVQTRAVAPTPEGRKEAIRYNFIDSAVALNGAFLVNAALLIVAASVFFRNGVVVSELQQAHATLTPLVGGAAAALFAVALLASGQSSTLTGTLAGQIVMEGFLHLRLSPWISRTLTRVLALIPAVIVILWKGDKGTYDLLILSQVVLSLQLPFAVIPLIAFTGSRKIMGDLAIGLRLKIVAWAVAALLVSLNGWLLWEIFHSGGGR